MPKRLPKIAVTMLFAGAVTMTSGCAGQAAAPDVMPAPVPQPAPIAQLAPVPQPPIQPYATPLPPSPTPAAPVAATIPTDAIGKALYDYAVSHVESMNVHIKPGISQKEVTPTGDGFRARYMLIDPNSLATAYSVSENKAVAYVGRVMYHEVEYVSNGKTREEALAGPFGESSRRPITEIIMHIRGKWTYKY